MQNITKVLKLIKKNIWTLVGFESMFKIISLLIFTPLFLNIFKLITKITGYNYLSLENVTSFLTNPLTLIMLLILIMLMTFYTLFDISTIIIILDASYQNKQIKIFEAMLIAFQKCRNVLHLKNIPLAFLVLFLIPFLHIGVSSSFITTIKIPEFILDYILNNRLLTILVVILVFILVMILLRWLYSLHYYILENKSFKEARKSSIQLSHKKHLKDFITIVLVQFITTLIYLVLLFIGILLIITISEIFKNLLLKSLTTTIIWIFIALSFVIYSALATPISYATLSIMYYFHKNAKHEKIHFVALNENDNKTNLWLKKTCWGLGILSLIIGTIFTYGLYQGKYNFNIEYLRTLEVTAHRGASILYPENTMSAFIGAKELGADWIELDVQQSKDGEIIVIHDTNFKRTTGVDKNTWELTLDEIEQLDAGRVFSEQYQNEKIPLLKDVLAYAKDNNIRLNIELKPTGYETDFEQKVVDIIKENHFEQNCVITSQVYNVLEKVKAYDADVKTVYVMSLAYGDILSLKAADNFSIEASSINKSLVKKIHNEGKEIYAWTVNTEENIRKMIDLNVDNIITDNITLAKDIIYSSKTSNVINEYVKFVQNIF